MNKQEKETLGRNWSVEDEKQGGEGERKKIRKLILIE